LPRLKIVSQLINKNNLGDVVRLGRSVITLAARVAGASFALLWAPCAAANSAADPQEHVVELTFESRKSYSDPFNDVDVDVIFMNDGQSWRVPTFWRGGQAWTVRFASPAPGEYSYRLESTDRGNPDLNGHEGKIKITAYSGNNPLFKHGMLRVSANHRYFEYDDGTPFYWLGDTWWTGLSDRLSWEGFQTLAADRKQKGFTIIQICAGLVPPEEMAPADPGFRNEGGAAWDVHFERINPRYFDFADRRLLHLLEEGLTPEIEGSSGWQMGQIGVRVLKKHWRYLIARYGAYPVIWNLADEAFDPPEQMLKIFPKSFHWMMQRGWTEVASYIRVTDPYHHPLTVNEDPPPWDFPVQDESLLDFDQFQSSHWGWNSIATEVAQMNTHYARTSVTKPLVEGEVGYEKLGEIHLEDFQRTAFWLSMLNGAAGHTYGANGVWEAYTGDKPLHRQRWSFLTWQEGMNLPGSYQIGLGAKLLRRYRWWKFQPHPEWVTPRGTTLLEPRAAINDFDIGREVLRADGSNFQSVEDALEKNYPGGEWQRKNGNFRAPYAAGIPGEVRFIYIPTRLIFSPSPAPTVLGLEPGIRYHAYFWEPTSGTRIDLGSIERPAPGHTLFVDEFDRKAAAWVEHGPNQAVRSNGTLSASGETLLTLKEVSETNAVAAVDVASDAGAGLVLRYRDSSNYIAAMYSLEEKALYLLDRRKGNDGPLLGRTSITVVGAHLKLSAEVRDDKAVASISDGQTIYTTPIVDVADKVAGTAGLLHRGQGPGQHFAHFELRRSPVLVKDESLQRRLYDAQGRHRGDLLGSGMEFPGMKIPGWDEFGRDKHILLDAYRPERLPASGDWLLVLDTTHASSHMGRR